MRDTTTLGIGREALYSLISNVTMGMVGFAGTFIFARVLGASGLGVYQTALAAGFIFSELSSGISVAVRKRVSEVDIDPAKFFGGGLLLHVLFSLLVLALFLIFRNFAISYFGSREIALGVILVVVSLGFFDMANRTYAGIGYPARSSWMDTIRSAITLILQVYLLWIGLEAFGLIVGLTTATLVTGIITILVAGVRPTVPTRETIEEIYDFARWSVPNGLLNNLYSSSDILIITAAAGSTATGLYTVAKQLSQPAIYMASSIKNALYVKSSGRHSAGQDVIQDLTNSVAYAGLIAVPIFFGALSMPNAIPRTVFGGEFAAAGSALIGMALFQISNVYVAQFESIFGSIDRPDVVFRVNIGVTGVHLPLAVVLGYSYGLLGVVGATVFAELVRFIIYQYLAYAKFGRVVFPRPVSEQFLSGITMFVIIEIVLRFIEIRSWLFLLPVVSGGAIVYFTTLFTISSHFRLAIRHAVPIEVGPLKTP